MSGSSLVDVCKVNHSISSTLKVSQATGKVTSVMEVFFQSRSFVFLRRAVVSKLEVDFTSERDWQESKQSVCTDRNPSLRSPTNDGSAFELLSFRSR